MRAGPELIENPYGSSIGSGPFLFACIRDGERLVKLIKTLNNNVAVVEDDDGRECVAIGLGIGFTPKGHLVDKSRIERTFSSDEQRSRFEQLAASIPERYFNLASEIIEYAQASLKAPLSNSLYLTLTDHISYVHERMEKDLLPKNSLTWEIRRYYPDEFKLGQKAVELLEEELGGKLNDDEAASIALHVVNAELEDSSPHSRSMEQIRLMDQVMQIIRYQARLTVGEGDLDYQRLAVHVRFFVQRVLGGTHAADAGPLYKMVRDSYPEAYSVTERVRAFVEGKIGRSINDDEITYLIIHIQRLLSKR